MSYVKEKSYYKVHWKRRIPQKQQAVKRNDKGQNRIGKEVCTARKDSQRNADHKPLAPCHLLNLSKSDRLQHSVNTNYKNENP